MSNSDDVKGFLKEYKNQRYCDNCISEKTGVTPNQQVNQITKPLKGLNDFDRIKGVCVHCGGSKKVTWAK